MVRRMTLAVTAILFSTLAHGQSGERILSFDSDIAVHADGTMTVQETIRVTALGRQIKRGIYRDFPTTYRDARGNKIVVGFDVQEVTRDGLPEAYHTESIRNGVRVYFGRKEHLLPHGEHVYRFTYKTTHQLGFFDSHDELYWNVTGNGWGFVIDAVSAKVTLPDGIAAPEISAEAYTGPQGARGTDSTSEVPAPSRAVFSSTRPLGPGEGMTIVVMFPKGFVTEPTLSDDVGLIVQRQSALLAMFAGVFIVLIYYTFIWLRVGVDPPKGRIAPREEPPDGYSPAALRYVRRMGLDAKAFSVALISMAVKRYLYIEQEGKKDFYIVRGNSQDDVLTDEERSIADKLFAEGDRVELDDSNHKIVGGAQTAFRKSLTDQFKGVYFRRNGVYIFLGMLLTIGAIGGGLLGSGGNPSVAFGVGIALLLFANIVFAYLLKAPTREGRRMMDEIEGFRMFLNGEGMARFSAQANQEELSNRFEQFLPYAIALDRESRWADEFTNALTSNSQDKTQHHYVPVWYHGSYWQAGGVHSLTNNLAGSFSGAVASSTTAPGSSSGGGGGGFSGGGGGGGGGGGW